jgi:hypothetical protein
MSQADAIPLVRCRLDGPEDNPSIAVRYIPLGEFDLWQHLMESRHRRKVTIEAVSVWIPDVAARGMWVLPADVLEPVFRVSLERPGPHGALVPVERFFAVETYPLAREALLSHVPGLRRLRATPGYFVTEQSARRLAHSA